MRKKIIGMLLVTILITCHTNVHERSEYVNFAMLKDLAVGSDSSVSLYMNQIDPKLIENIKIVEFKAKVPSVIHCMTQLTYITYKYGGYVSQDKLKNVKLAVHSKTMSEDSISVVTQYLTSNTVMLRIPHFHIDTVLKEINQNLEFIDYKYSRVNDSMMELNTADNFLKRLKSPYQANIAFQEDSRVSNYEKLVDQYTHSFGAIILTIYENPAIKNEKTPRINLGKEYQRPFLVQTKIELSQGVKLLMSGFYFLMRYWPIVALIILSSLLVWINHVTTKTISEIINRVS